MKTNQLGLLPADFLSRAEGLQLAVRRRPRTSRVTYRQDTVQRYEQLRAVITPMVDAGFTTQQIATALFGLKIVTPNGKQLWQRTQVARVLAVLGLKTRGQRSMLGI